MKTTYSMDRNRVYLPPPHWLGWWVESGKKEEEAEEASAKVRGGLRSVPDHAEEHNTESAHTFIRKKKKLCLLPS